MTKRKRDGRSPKLSTQTNPPFRNTTNAVALLSLTPIIVWVAGETIEIDPFTERRARPSMFDEGKNELFGDSPLEVV